MRACPDYAIFSLYIVFATVFFGARSSAQIAIKPDTPAVTQWRSLTPSIQKTLEAENENCAGTPGAEIVDAFGMRGDPVSAALVHFCGGGAYADNIVAMRFDHGKPVLAKFRDARGEKVENGFASGASAMHSADVKLVAEKKAIFVRFADNDAEGRPDKCGVKAYVWNARAGTFDLDPQLSNTASMDYCRSLREK